MPHSGHGTPVAARSGHTSGGCAGSSGHTAAAPTSPAAATRTAFGARTPSVDVTPSRYARARREIRRPGRSTGPNAGARGPQVGAAGLRAALLGDDDAL